MAEDNTETLMEGKQFTDDESEFQDSDDRVQILGSGNELPKLNDTATTFNQSLVDKETYEPSFTDSSSTVAGRINSSEAEIQEAEKKARSMSVPQRLNTNRTRQHKRMRIISLQENFISDADTFEEAFSKHRYSGSFRLRFQRDELISRKNTPHVIESTESATLVLHDENPMDIRELSEQTTSPPDPMINSDISKESSEMEYGEGSCNTGLHEPRTVVVNDTAVQQDLVGRDSATAIIITNNEEDSSFHFYSQVEEPVLHPTFKQRAEKAVNSIVQVSNSTNFEPSCCHCAQDCTNCVSSGLTVECCQTNCNAVKIPCCHFPNFSIEMKAASRQGTKMLRSFLFPTMPKLLTDLWILAELGITLAQFILSVVSIMIDSNRAFNIIYLVLASIALVLALVDAFIYFKDFASCSQYFHHCCSRLISESLKYRSRVEGSQQNNLEIRGSSNSSFSDLDAENEQIATVANMRRAHYGCCHLGDRSMLRMIASEWFELVRTILSELLIYPLLMFDLLDVIVGGSYQVTNTIDRLNLSLFIIGSIFLILSVYVSRAFMVISMTVQLRRMPIDPSKSKTNILGIVTEFCLYVLFQISVHIAVIMAVGAKLYQENPTPCEDLQSSCTQVSPTLIYVMVCGGILPFYGMLVFFILNYFQLREISVGFWTNMVSLLHSENFSNLIFSTKGVEESKLKAKHLINSVHLHQVKSQLTNIMSTPSLVKILYPLKFPFFIPVLFLYVAILYSFIAALAFTYDEQNAVFNFTLFENNFSPAFFILAIIVLASNLHVIILVLVATLAAVMIILIIILQPVFCILGVFMYAPVGGCLSLWNLVSSRMNRKEQDQ